MLNQKAYSSLLRYGFEIERKAYHPDRIHLDGSPYTGDFRFLRASANHFGIKALRGVVTELGGDINCGNWLTMAGLILLNIPIKYPLGE